MSSVKNEDQNRKLEATTGVRAAMQLSYSYRRPVLGVATSNHMAERGLDRELTVDVHCQATKLYD